MTRHIEDRLTDIEAKIDQLIANLSPSSYPACHHRPDTERDYRSPCLRCYAEDRRSR